MKQAVLIVLSALLAFPLQAGEHERLKNESGERFIEKNEAADGAPSEAGLVYAGGGSGRKNGKGSREDLKEEIRERQKRRPQGSVPVPSQEREEPSGWSTAWHVMKGMGKGAYHGAKEGNGIAGWQGAAVGAVAGAIIGGINAYISGPE